VGNSLSFDFTVLSTNQAINGEFKQKGVRAVSLRVIE
jgi:hypothetical protein